jgi:predicted ATPase/DNA-binding CsgD family transcriptional regulator
MRMTDYSNHHMPERMEAYRFFNLPTELTTFLGREKECATLVALLLRREVRLLTITGMGGVGKTRLALACDLQGKFADGVCFVPLSTIRDPELVIPMIARTLGREIGDRPVFEMLQSFLHDKHLLLLLDNFEQVATAAPQLSALLASCPKLKMLVTSREPLHVTGEYEFSVPPLEFPDITATFDEEILKHNVSVRLFVERAQAVKSDFNLTGANIHAIAQICCLLEGLPLALELAAARMKLLSPQALLARLSHRLRVLTSGRRDAPLRHQTLRHCIQWSYDLLTVEEQILFRRLCVFVGGCPLSAIEAIYTELGDDADGVLDGVASLLDKSLIQRTEQGDLEPRIQMLETIREFGLECLQACGEMERVCQAHIRYYLRWFEEGRRSFAHFRGASAAAGFLLELGNLRAVKSRVMALSDQASAQQLGAALAPFPLLWGDLNQTANLVETRQFLEQALKDYQGEVTEAYAWSLASYGCCIGLLGDVPHAEAACREAIGLCRQLRDIQGAIVAHWMLLSTLLTKNDYRAAQAVAQEAVTLAKVHGGACTLWGGSWMLGHSLHYAGFVARRQGQYSEARAMLVESVALCTQSGDFFYMSWSNMLLGEVAYFEGNAGEARVLLKQCLDMFKKMGVRTLIAEALRFLGLLDLYQGDADAGRTLLEESLYHAREIDNSRGIAWSQIWLARIAFARQQIGEARHLLEEALALALSVQDRLFITEGMEGLAIVVAAQGELIWAVRLLGAAEALREAMDAPIAPIDRIWYENQVATLRQELGEASFLTSWRDGSSMAPQQALTVRAVAPFLEHRAQTESLTAREMDVLRLLSSGLSNKEIAEQLHLSTVTVNSYLRTIYSKLGVSSRTQAIRYAHDYHLF